MMKIILASASPRRRLLFLKAGIPFIVRAGSVSEKTSLKQPSAIVKSLAMRKAMNIAGKYPRSPVIGADTIVVRKGRIIGKPKNRKSAMRMLKMQNGGWQSVYTGVAAVWLDKNRRASGYEVSRCKARKLSIKELNRLAGRHMDKAGAYAVQNERDGFIEKIKGRYDNVVGLPMNLAMRLLKKVGCKQLCSK